MRPEKLITLNGVTKTQKEWSIETGLTTGSIRGRLRRKWTLEDALSKPRVSSIVHLLEWRKTHPEWNDLRLKALRSSEKAKAAVKKLLERPERQPGIQNQRSADWSLRDARGKVHKFRNVAHFVRENKHLFPEGTTVLKYKNGRKYTNAENGLSLLRPTNKHQRGSWHGWTWYSGLEDKLNKGKDLLERNPDED